MKLCPECEFIYEDDQSFCDMDGRELVNDAGRLAFEETAPSTFSQPQQLAETPVSLPSELTSNLSPVLLDSPPSREQSRSFAIAGAVAVVLVALLFVVYYALTHRPRSGNANQASSRTSVQPQDSSASPATDAQVPGPDSVAVPGSVVDSPEQALSTPPDLTLKRSQVKSIQRLAPQSESTAVSAEEKNRKPQNANAQNRARPSRPESADAKKESKVSSFLKKTGRILKKPFQF